MIKSMGEAVHPLGLNPHWVEWIEIGTYPVRSSGCSSLNPHWVEWIEICSAFAKRTGLTVSTRIGLSGLKFRNVGHSGSILRLNPHWVEWIEIQYGKEQNEQTPVSTRIGLSGLKLWS